MSEPPAGGVVGAGLFLWQAAASAAETRIAATNEIFFIFLVLLLLVFLRAAGACQGIRTDYMPAPQGFGVAVPPVGAGGVGVVPVAGVP